MAQPTLFSVHPQPDMMVFITNAGHYVFLDNEFPSIHMRNTGNVEPTVKLDQLPSLRWFLHAASQNEFFLINLKSANPVFLCAVDDAVQVWEKTDANQPLTQLPNNFKWKFIACPHQDGCYYVVNSAQNKFLDTHGTDVAVWNNNGCDVPTIINGNTSPYAKNLRWYLFSCPSSALPTPPPQPVVLPSSSGKKTLRILHFSDTHNLHRTIESQYPIPSADIFLHTGDFSNRGTEDEVKYFNDWLGA